MTLVVLFSFIFFLYDQSLHFTRLTTGKSASKDYSFNANLLIRDSLAGKIADLNELLF